MASKKPTPKKTTRAETTAARTKFVDELYRQCKSMCQIRQEFADKFKCSGRSADRYYTAVRAALLVELGGTVDEHRAQSYAFNMAVAANEKLPLPFRQAANREVNKLLGLYAPVKVASTDTAGKDIPLNARRPSIAEIDAELDLLMESGCLGGGAA